MTEEVTFRACKIWRRGNRGLPPTSEVARIRAEAIAELKAEGKL